MDDQEEILGKKGAELFKELLRVYPGACPEDYFANGAWRDDLLSIDWQLVQAHREEAGAEDPPPLEDIVMPELPKVTARAPLGPGEPLKPSPTPTASKQPKAAMPFKLWGSGGAGKAALGASIKPTVTTVRIANSAGGVGVTKPSVYPTASNGSPRAASTTTTTTIKTTMAGRKPIFPSAPYAGRSSTAASTSNNSNTNNTKTSNANAASSSSSAAPDSTLAELKRIQLFVQKWELSPIKTKLMLAKIGPNGRKYVLNYFQPKSGGDSTDELKTFIDDHQAKGSWAGVPAAGAATTMKTTITAPSNGGAVGRITPSGGIKRPAPKGIGLLSISAKAHAKPKPAAKGSPPARMSTPTTTTTTTTTTTKTTTIRASSLLQSAPPKAKAKAKLHARLLPPSQGAHPTISISKPTPPGPSAGASAASSSSIFRPKAGPKAGPGGNNSNNNSSSNNASSSGGISRPKLSSGVQAPKAAMTRPSGLGGKGGAAAAAAKAAAGGGAAAKGGKGAAASGGPPVRGSLASAISGGTTFRPSQSFRSTGKGAGKPSGPSGRAW